MTGIGTIVNMAAITAGGLLGIAFKGGLKDRYQKTITQGVGLCNIVVGLSGVFTQMFQITDGGLQTEGTMLIIFSLVLGGLLGEWLNIEQRMERLGNRLKSALRIEEGNGAFTEGFVSSSLLFCVGAMAIVGSLNDGLSQNPSLLYAKAVMDGTLAVVFGSTFGLGVVFSALSVGLYQGAITATAGFIAPFLSQTLIGNLSMVGSVLILGIGLNLTLGQKIKIGNLLPSLLIPVIYQICCGFLS